ncbi:HAD family hydrolase [Pseudokordiimonas caeni]|uniref:HAD family hydrolase n=1 Tax=Pseudokordiimonas caeni TaxID=2997908 RepID=UPI002811D479|nr:HAD family phosphatase [Pseudokordiimonas caeni]
MRITAVVFDIGNVLVRWDPRLLYSKLIPDAAELDRFLTDIVTLEWHTHHDKGRPFAEGVRILSEQHPDHADLIRAFDERWDETIGPVIEGTVALMERLKAKGVPLYGLTNFSAEKWVAFARDYAFVKLFDGVVVSGEERLVKPDPAIFERLASRYGLTPAETLFIDDRDENVRAAEALGFRGHVFTGPEGLEATLAETGLI